MADLNPVFITADEVDEPPPPPEAFDVDANPRIPLNDDDGLPVDEAQRLIVQQTAPRPMRPPLRRDKPESQSHSLWTPQSADSAPPVTTQEPTSDESLTNSTNINGNPNDSLSLGQLKKLVHDIPKVEPAPYAFQYEDSSSFEEDLEDLFEYESYEELGLQHSTYTFYSLWKDYRDEGAAVPFVRGERKLDWREADESAQRTFLGRLSRSMSSTDDNTKGESFECLLFIALGCFWETAGLRRSQDNDVSSSQGDKGNGVASSEHEYAGFQVQCMKENIALIVDTIPLSNIFDFFCAAFDFSTNPDGSQKQKQNYTQQSRQFISSVLLYLIVDLAKREGDSPLGYKLREALAPFSSKLLTFLTDILVRTRWDDSDSVPPSKILQILWKTILLSFGGMDNLEKIKNAFGKDITNGDDQTQKPRITASPLDYHVFRQEIISKYPAYNPPPPLFPFEPENNSFLPPMQETFSKNGTTSPTSSSVGPANISSTGTSIMYQPVHIATPAPSPPPSPAGPGGKGLKKQNFQTNQLFPFLYPPLDESSNDIGGKGTTEMQDLLAGRKWHGSDIPTSILEAAALFASRMRATRAMRQLWEERVRFMKFEQGYGSLDSVNSEEIATNGDETTRLQGNSDGYEVLTEDQRASLDAVDAFYKAVLPRLQSVVIVLLKTLVQTITALITQADALENIQGNGGTNDANGAAASEAQAKADDPDKIDEDNDPNFHEVKEVRNQEIAGKAVSGVLLLLLKWFKASHILKFEYLSQLLLDSNYIQFILKLFAHQELERAVNYRCERRDMNFFALCKENSRNKQLVLPGWDYDPDEDDDALPPPIKLTKEQVDEPSATTATNNQGVSAASTAAPTPAPTQPPPNPPPNPPAPEVDELGYPTSTHPVNPITRFSWRAFFTSINYLRILQKIIKSKPHRQLLMVQGKYSNTLKKHLKVPQADVRLYTLKIIKGQVPYCHRKWRSSNMRIITAIYLHVKPGLRDEWLSGLDVEQEVGEALPAEQALRALTYWYNLRRYPAEMGVAESASVSASESVLPPGIAGKFSEDFSLDSEPELSALDSIVGREEVLDGIAVADIPTNGFSLSASEIANLSQMQHTSKAASRESSPHKRQRGSPDRRHSISNAEQLEEQESPQQQQQNIPPLMFRQQDFFLRELEKMDLGFSLPSPSGSRSSSRHSSRPVSSAGAGDMAATHVNGALDCDPSDAGPAPHGRGPGLYGRERGLPADAVVASHPGDAELGELPEPEEQAEAEAQAQAQMHMQMEPPPSDPAVAAQLLHLQTAQLAESEALVTADSPGPPDAVGAPHSAM